MSAGAEAFYVVAHLVEGLTYKPGSRFDLWREPGGTKVAVSREVPDARNPEGPLVLFMQCAYLSDHMVLRCAGDSGYIEHEIRKLIHQMEAHEADEFLRCGGVLVHDPHQGTDPVSG